MAQRIVARRPEIASLILVVGGMIYGVLCLPAIGQRGFPPIDPIWTGVTFLWVTPIALSALFDSVWYRARRINLLVYLLATALIDSATPVLVVPKSISGAEILIGTLILYGPAHLIVGFLVEGLCQLGFAPARKLVDVDPGDSEGLPRFGLLTWLILHSLICVTIGLPFAYRSLAFAMIRARAVAKADGDWAAGKAVVYRDVDDRLAEKIVDYQGDVETGLEIEYRFDHPGFPSAYNRRIAQLIAERGLPAWSMKRFIPTDTKLRSMLESTEMVEVTSFPYDVNSNIVLMRRGTLTRWDSTISNGNDDLTIATEKSGTVDSVSGVAPVHVKVDGEVIYVRNGSDWVGVFHESGIFLGSATRQP